MARINLNPLNCNVDLNSCVKGLWASRRLGRPKSAIKKLKKEMAVLKAKRDDIKNQIREAEREGKIPTNEVIQWLQEVEILKGKVADVEKDFQTMRCCSCSCFNQIDGTSSRTHEAGDQVPIRESSTHCSIILRVVDKLEEADGLMSRAVALNPIATDLNRLESGIQKLEKETARLRAKRDDIKNKITKAEREGKIPTKEVSQWLAEVERLEGQVTGIKLDFQSISCFSCNNCFNQTETGVTSSQTQQAGDQASSSESSKCCSINRRATEKLGEANELMSRVSQLDPIVIVGPPELTAMLPISYQPPVGINSYVEDIVSYIDDGGEGNIIGIHGMGGIGKTTILKSIKQHYLSKHTRFDHVIWVVASKDHQMKRLQMDIAEQLGLNTLQENDDDKTCGKKLFNYLNSRNCLLLLDDIWEHVDLQLLGMAHSVTKQGQQQQQPHKVVIFTTRNETVCAQMKAKKGIKVKCLDPVQAWQLFEENSNKDVLSSDAGIKFVAEELAKECAGLPLALVTVARAMLRKNSWEAWKEALHQIRYKHEWRTIGLPKDSLLMYNAFKLSYDSLENDFIRECLLCCALWPEDDKIDKFVELIPCWIGCGIICEFNVINEAFAIGCSYLEALIAASLLEDYSYKNVLHDNATSVQMHDVIRDMALLMVSGLEGSKRKWIVKAGIGLRDLPRQEEWQEAERASFIWSNIKFLQEYGASTFPKLSVLILRNNKGLKFSPNFFASMPHLTYLDLAFCDIANLPVDIGCLTELQYLDLSYNLITTLPPKFNCLCKLEYLLLHSNKLYIISNGTISNLLMLKWLDIRQYYASEWWWDELKCFKGCHQLSVGIKINATRDNIKRLNKLPPNVFIRELILKGKNSSELPNYNLGTPQWGYNIVTDHLETMAIEGLRLDRLVLAACMGREESSFRSLKSLHFEYLALLEEISLDRVRLYNLRELYIIECHMLKDVSWVLQLPCLNILQIINCSKMKELIISDRVGNSISSFSIQSLILDRNWNLKRIANRPLHFPYLKYVHVSCCPGLSKLPFGAEILLNNRLKRIEGEGFWWNRLEWDDESIKDSLDIYFRSFPW